MADHTDNDGGDDGDDRACDRAPAALAPTQRARPDIARLAHELRTPLSAITMLAEIIRDERLGPVDGARYRGYAADIHDSARHAMSVLSAYIDQAGIGASGAASGERAASAEAFGLAMDFVELDLGELSAGVVSASMPLAERAGVRLAPTCPVGLPRLIADRRGVRQILDNLIGNALKFTPPGGNVTVAISHAVGGPIVLTVRDTGDGMTAAELARARAGAIVPEPFRRRSGGTGFGLPLVHALAMALGAELAIDGAPGQGTSVSLTFPQDRLVPV